MQLTPNIDEFKRLAATHDRVPVARQVLGDALTPVLAFHRIDDGQTACLFESVVGGEKVGRYSFLAVEPFMELEASGSQVTIRKRNGSAEGSDGKSEHIFESPDPLDELRRQIASIRVAKVDGMPPFAGGAIGYAGYDVIRYVENLPDAPQDDRNLPDMSFAFYDRMLVFDNVNKTLTIIVLADTSGDAGNGNHEQAYRAAEQSIDEMIRRVHAAGDSLPYGDVSDENIEPLHWESNFTAETFSDAVRKCVEYIEAGDIFQVVISQRLQAEVTCDPFEIYRTLRVVNPSPFMFFLRTGETTLVGSSPEIMCRVLDGEVTVRPLAGTRKRGATDEQDRALEQELLADPKERAEHIMLVDLGRNDVGRVAQYGSISLPDLMVVERYSHVMHISSTVTGQLREGCDSFDALAASLPAGTVSGAPKVRAMEIIDQLEPNRRGPYAGAVGYIDFNGNMDTCIALRTLVIQGQTAYVQAGAGIVADSVPQSEYEETLNKARVLLKAIEISQQRTKRAAT